MTRKPSQNQPQGIQTPIPRFDIDKIWVPATWNEYLRVLEDSAQVKSNGYYTHGRMQVEMQLPVSFDHRHNQGIIALAINLYDILNGIPFTVLNNCSLFPKGEIDSLLTRFEPLVRQPLDYSHGGD